MDIEKLNEFFSSSNIHTFYPFSLPSDESIGSVFNVSGGTGSRAGVHKVYLRIITQETHPKLALDKSKEISKYLQKLVGTFFNEKEVLQVTADTPTPLYIGEENGVFSVSWNFTILEG